MSRRTGAFARAFVAWLSRGPLLALAGMTMLGGLASPTLAAVRDYALCFGDDKGPSDDQGLGGLSGPTYKKEAGVDKGAAEQRIAACTVIAEDDTEASRLRVSAYFYRGVARDDLEDLDGAIADYSEAIALDPKRASVYFNRGSDWYNKGDDERAIADFNIAISLEPSAGDAYASRGWAFLRRGKVDAAILDFQQAIEAEPRSNRGHTGLGAAWAKKGEREKSIAEYGEAIRLDPADLIALVNRGIARAARGEFDSAIADYDAAIRADPQSADAYVNRSAAWIGKNDWARAIADANQAIALDAGIVDGYYSRGVAWANKGNNDRAVADFDKAVELDATDARAWFGRSLTRARKGDTAGAAADCRKAIELDTKKAGGCEATPAPKRRPQARPPSSDSSLQTRCCGQPPTKFVQNLLPDTSNKGWSSRYRATLQAQSIPSAWLSDLTLITPTQFTTGRWQRPRTGMTPSPPPTAGAPSSSTRNARAHAPRSCPDNKAFRPPRRRIRPSQRY